MTSTNPAADLQPEAPELLRAGGSGNGGSRFPVPDPTTLTTEALRREVASLQVLIEQRIDAFIPVVWFHRVLGRWKNKVPDVEKRWA